MFEMVLECPECGHLWTIQQGQPGIRCNCHLFCTQGTKPSDCSITAYTDDLQYAWPAGMHNDPAKGGEDVAHITGYCSTHEEYIYKMPVWVEADWDEWFSRRAPKKFRLLQRGQG